MSRSPLSYPLSRTTDGEAGGIADLQTDVMRFMAILAICLVAIFALVQSIPLNSLPTTPESIEPIPVPVSKVTPEPAPEPVLKTAPLPVPADPIPTPIEPTQQEGFTLQFENDLALTRLIARNEVGLFAMIDGEALRMNVNRGRFSFWRASTPNEFHEMDASTVPSEVATALQRTNNDPAVRWGVTLPPHMQQQLDNMLRTGKSGAIYIGANGQLRLEN